ncbi:beta-ketoacyl-ACP synthase II [Clostridium cylindrosporum]|uniref:3-oxoacyl-[acyl-carrier-protein] synthase 2 n=1 Tax=Clostridium cylindrosporum DSM 605 TaxID=1121307 RepID=A0A0J8DAR4_CLOCY|nr:beta-ketoacyl-ACP synthase II [Clostridium cylindrosporum]KMT23135.1 3-oxoacyl-[acyl-carrier-protein] synthase 2 [Clostridium cylindrosporum DSM 605]
MKRRVVVTGMGAITPIGNNVEEFWKSAKNGVCGVDFIKAFDTEDSKVKLAAEVKDFSADGCIDKKEAKRMGRYTQFAVCAADEAVKDSGINLDEIDNYRFGVSVGSGIGGLETMEKEHTSMTKRGLGKVSPLTIPIMIANMAAGNIAIRFNAKGPCTCTITACATGTDCIGEAFRNIKNGYVDLMLAGGAEASITPLGISGFTALTALSKSEDPKRASIPFDKERNGFVMGEGAGMLLLEEYEHAKKRGAKIYAEVVGYGITCDAHHITAPSPDGEGGARAIALAIDEANINKEDVDYVNAHGTSTELNDKFETIAIKTVFGEHAKNLLVSSTKSMTGHLLGAAGAVESIACINALREGFIPPTVGLIVPDEDCDLDYVPQTGREKNIKYAMSNSLGFGGHNSVLLFKRWEN